MIPAGPHPLMMCGGADPLDEYLKIERSIRLNSADSAKLTCAFGAATSQNIWTISAWIKVGDSVVLLAKNTGPWYEYVQVDSSGVLFWCVRNAGGTIYSQRYASVAKLRDPTGHLHVVVRKTASLTVEADVNGVPVTLTLQAAGSPSDAINTAGDHEIGYRYDGTTSNYSNGYVNGEYRFVDGQAVPSSALGKTHPKTGQWRPIPYAGTYGNNGRYYDFKDGSAATSATLGKDRSGNNNDATPVNISVATGVGCDLVLDTATWNACTWNPLAKTGGTITNGCLDLNTGTGDQVILATQVLAREWYFEVPITTAGSGLVGVGRPEVISSGANAYFSGLSWTIEFSTGKKWNTAGVAFYGAAVPNGSVVRCAGDGNGNVWLGVDNTWIGGGNPAAGTNPAFTGVTGRLVPLAMCNSGVASVISLNCGQRTYAFSSPWSKGEVCTKNLPIKPAGPMKSTDAFVAVKDSGANLAATLAAARAGWPAYLDICKSFGNEGWRWIFSDDPGNYIDPSNAATAKAAVPAFGGASYVGYSIRIGAGFGTATGTFNHTNLTPSVINDGLSSTRKVVILHRESAGGGNFYVYHPDLAAGKLLYLNTTAAETTDASINTVTAGGFTAAAALPSGTYRWLSIEEKDGLTKFGKYTGVATFPFLNCNNRPAMALFKRMGSAGQWPIFDAARDTSNPTKSRVFANLSNAETDGLVGGEAVDFYSNGMRPITTGSDINVAANDYAYIEFSAFPFRYANAR